LNRPHRMNAISLELPFQLRAAVERANADDRVRVIVLTGVYQLHHHMYYMRLSSIW
jgi:enoyl-CoA hydratase/carnithine racemase